MSAAEEATAAAVAVKSAIPATPQQASGQGGLASVPGALRTTGEGGSRSHLRPILPRPVPEQGRLVNSICPTPPVLPAETAVPAAATGAAATGVATITSATPAAPRRRKRVGGGVSNVGTVTNFAYNKRCSICNLPEGRSRQRLKLCARITTTADGGYTRATQTRFR